MIPKFKWFERGIFKSKLSHCSWDKVVTSTICLALSYDYRLWKWNHYSILYNFESLWALKFWWFTRNNLSYFSISNAQAQRSPHSVLWNSALRSAVSLRGLGLWSLCFRHSGVSWFTLACQTVLRCLGTKNTWVPFLNSVFYKHI